MARKVLILFLSCAALAACGFFVGRHTAMKEIEYVTVYKKVGGRNPLASELAFSGEWDITIPRLAVFSDTTTIVDSVFVPRPYAVHDTVYVPISTARYDLLDGRLRLQVSGYNPRLDWWELDEKTYVPARKRWDWGLEMGFGGLVPFNSAPTYGFFCGIGVQYHF